ncbi:MAG: hypothetical protein ACI9YL_000638 [Luteibaculaceae bacterium]|jgi:hypothetical protein
MKKVIILAAAVFALGLVSCKKEYTCCYKDSSGAEQSTLGGCSTSEMSKSDMEDVEKAGNDAITSCGSSCDGWKYECEK